MNLEEIIRSFILNYGVISVFVLVLLEYANFPLPSELVLPLMGVVGTLNGISYVEILVVSIIAGILGSLLNYLIGWYLGEKSILYIEKKFPKTKKSINVAYDWLNKYETLAVLLSRLVPIARTFISLVAGTVKMRLLPFIIYSSIGIGIWNAFLIGIGFICGENSTLIASIIKQYSIVVVILIMVAVIIKLVINKNKTNKFKN